MPDRFVHIFHDGNAKDGQAHDSYQSGWMAHWMRTSSNTPSRGNGCLAHCGGREEEEENRNTKERTILVQIEETRMDTMLDVIVGPSNISETEDIGAEISSDALVMNSRSLGNARSDMQSFPVYRFNPNIGSGVAPIKEVSVCDRHVAKSPVNYNSGHGSTNIGTSGTNFRSRLYRLTTLGHDYGQSQPESRTESLLECEKSYRSFQNKSLPVSMPFRYYLPETNSNIMPHNFKSSETPVPSFIRRSKEARSICGITSKDSFVNTNFTRLEQGSRNSCSCPTLSVCDKLMDYQITAKDCVSSFSRRDGDLGIHDPSKINCTFPISVGEKGKNMLSFSGTECSSSRESPPRLTKLEELNHSSHLLQKMPACSVHDVDTLRTCTTMDSVEGVAGCPPKFSQSIPCLLIRKKSGVNFSKGDQFIRDSRLCTDFKGNASLELLRLPPDCDSKQRAELQTPWNSTNTEGKQSVGDVGTDFLGLKKELSAETDTMDTDVCNSKNLSQGMASSTSNKDFGMGQNPVTTQATSVLPKDGSRATGTEIPDINQYPIEYLAAQNSITGKRDLNTSRTESLDVDAENLVSHVEKRPQHLNSSPDQQDVHEGEPSSRMVKRLKLSAQDSLCEAKKTEGGSSGKKGDKLFSKIMSYSTSSSEPMFMKCHDKREMMKLNKSMVIFKNWESSSPTGSVKKEDREDQSLSHPWIQRWCHNEAMVLPWMKRAAPVVCEPEIIKATPRKQLPSIAAMALMGKATKRFRPCEFRKRGPVIVWNTEGGFCEHS